MALKTETKVINNIKYTVRLLPTSQTIALGKTLQSVVLPIFAAYNEYNNFSRDSWVPEAIAAYIVQMESIDIVEVCRVLFYDTHINYDGGFGATKSGTGKLVFGSGDYDNDYDFDVHFSGKIESLVELLVFAIKVNCPDFFSKASYLAEDFKASAKSSKRKEAELKDQETESSAQ